MYSQCRTLLGLGALNIASVDDSLTVETAGCGSVDIFTRSSDNVGCRAIILYMNATTARVYTRVGGVLKMYHGYIIVVQRDKSPKSKIYSIVPS